MRRRRGGGGPAACQEVLHHRIVRPVQRRHLHPGADADCDPTCPSTSRKRHQTGTFPSTAGSGDQRCIHVAADVPAPCAGFVSAASARCGRGTAGVQGIMLLRGLRACLQKAEQQESGCQHRGNSANSAPVRNRRSCGRGDAHGGSPRGPRRRGAVARTHRRQLAAAGCARRPGAAAATPPAQLPPCRLGRPLSEVRCSSRSDRVDATGARSSA